MLLLATFLSFGWPVERTIWVENGYPLPQGEVAVRLSRCCGSMLPAIQGGELAYAEPYSGQPLHEGEIISTTRFTHRITAISKNAVRTAGDANSHSDGWTSKHDIKHIIRYIIRPSIH